MITREWFEQTSHKCTFEEYVACDCIECNNTECPHRDAFRRFPESDGGLGLCPNLKNHPEEEKQMAPRVKAIKDTKSQMNDCSIDLVDEYYDSKYYISDAISQKADDDCSIYYSDQVKWLREDPDSLDYIEQAVRKFGIDHEDFDFWGLITSGQYLQANDKLYSDIENIIMLSALYHLPDDATEEMINTVCDNINSRIDHNDRFDNIANAVFDIMTEFEEKKEA